MKLKFDKNFFIATKEDKDFVVYESPNFRLTEVDLLTLIKICIVNKRNIKIGKKLMAVYRDSLSFERMITEQKLKAIGVKDVTSKTKTRKKR
jgi:hypothetical protein